MSTLARKPRSRSNSASYPLTLNDEEAQLFALITKKIAIEKELTRIESSIFAVESTYLEESQAGNVVKGFKGYSTVHTDNK